MIHYHGTPISPRALIPELAGRSFCVSFAEPRDLEICHRLGEGVMLDNGAFSIWRAGRGDVDVNAYAEWAYPWLDYQTTWCVVPDKIDGTEDQNDELIADWERFGFQRAQCAPVWHMHESLDRLIRLCASNYRVCIGSSGDFAVVGNAKWRKRMAAAMDFVCGNGPAPCWLHMLRGLQFAGGPYPFASADSTNIARNHNGNNVRDEAPKSVRAMADQIDAQQTRPTWRVTPSIAESPDDPQMELAA